ncbi:hypothetical protein BDP81DRAFT_420007 [Colletotrichum phormii]|uniref:Uncharacterized protein n=1 Tax=Colletotrichum phormii TaxID=359342 RepID=A0AAJ0EIJ0_9PEZI|nr:uncharacterized protein BDP81DRAFT_420007 [Colletotrichum phormii]KAK1640418.1 hypothetical protein BDP81DRAFT_420007 [Colletotrichum phormii]
MYPLENSLLRKRSMVIIIMLVVIRRGRSCVGRHPILSPTWEPQLKQALRLDEAPVADPCRWVVDLYSLRSTQCSTGGQCPRLAHERHCHGTFAIRLPWREYPWGAPLRSTRRLPFMLLSLSPTHLPRASVRKDAKSLADLELGPVDR